MTKEPASKSAMRNDIFCILELSYTDAVSWCLTDDASGTSPDSKSPNSTSILARSWEIVSVLWHSCRVMMH